MTTGKTDWFMFVIASVLALFGALMVYSASAMMAMKESQEKSQYTYFFKQFGFVLIGIVLMFAVSRIDYHLFQNTYVVAAIVLFSVVALLAVFGFPPINGARRWIRFSGFSFQPSELAKVALPILLAWFLAKREDNVGELKATVIPSLACFGLFAALVMAEKDLGTTIVLSLIFTAVYFAAGAKLVHIASVAGTLISQPAAVLSQPNPPGRSAPLGPDGQVVEPVVSCSRRRCS